jgi:Type IV pili component
LTRPFRIAPLSGSLALLMLASGCATGSAGPDPAPLTTPLSRYALRMEPGLDRIALAVHEDGVSANQAAHLRALADRWRAAGSSAMIIQGPNGGDPVAIQQAWAIKAALEQFGVPGQAIQVVGYDGPNPRAPVLAGFEVLRPYIPNCAEAMGRMTGRASNAPSPNLGCAVNANLAAQIAEPNDIARPRPMSPVDSGRSAVVFDNYRRGQATSAPQETLVDGRISNAVD